MLTSSVRVTAVLAGIVLLAGGCRPAPSPIISDPVTASPSAAVPTTEATSRPAPPSAPDISPTPEIDPSPSIFQTLPEVSLDVELFYSERWMRVRQLIDIVNRSPDVWEEVLFNVPLNAVPDAFYLDAVTVTAGANEQDALPPFLSPETMLRIPLPEPLLPGAAVQIALRYRVVIPPVARTDWPPVGTTGWGADLIQAGEWYPALVPYVDGEGWREWRYHPVGDPTFYPLTNVSLAVRTEPGVIVASGGRLGEPEADPAQPDEDGVWRFRVEGARGVALTASDRYEVLSAGVGGVPITSFYLPEHAEAGEAALTIAAESIALFETLYGPYPYQSLTVAENNFFGGMEYSAFITVTDYAYLIYAGRAPSLLHALIAHEVAHQWWYGAVGNDQVNEPWLDEAVAFYSELLYFEHYYPEAVGWWWEKRVDLVDPRGPVDVTIYSYATSPDFILLMYGQAARFMRDLRQLMGDDAFFAFLRGYYARFQWQTVSAADFFETLREYTDRDPGLLIAAYFASLTHEE